MAGLFWGVVIILQSIAIFIRIVLPIADHNNKIFQLYAFSYCDHNANCEEKIGMTKPTYDGVCVCVFSSFSPHQALYMKHYEIIDTTKGQLKCNLGRLTIMFFFLSNLR